MRRFWRCVIRFGSCSGSWVVNGFASNLLIGRCWALLGMLPRSTLRRLQLVMSPDTVLRWHRDLLNRRHVARSRPKRAGRPRTVASIRRLVLRLARENGTSGYRRIHGELALLGITVAASTVWEILKDAGIDPSPDRAATSWAAFLGGQAEAILACDFIETVTLSGQRQYILAVIEHATRRIRVLGTTAHATASWVAQAARNLVMDLEDAGSSIRYLIRDRDGKFSAAFDEVLADAGIQVVLYGVRMPRMNAVMERWVATCRRELLDGMLIWNQAHLLHALREFETHYNLYRPHRSLDQSAPLHPAPEPITSCADIVDLNVRRRDPLGGILHEYDHAS